MRRVYDMPFGARPRAGGGAAFRLFAPGARTVELVCGDPCGGPTKPFPMERHADGWFTREHGDARAGLRYAFRIDAGLVVPDPASRCAPEGVHRPSELVDPVAFVWDDAGWLGRPWHDAVVYELHVGCFTPAGTFAAAIERLDDLVALGVTAIELMPVAAFAGQRGWGYDGVLPFAPHPAYGRPDDLKRLVAAAHARGLMVLLDVVYNHFGPDGNYLHAYAPTFFNPAIHTPWGSAINLDGPGSRLVRDFFIDNALYWLHEFHFDGLRIDAVHALHDSSPVSFVDELVLKARASTAGERQVHVVLENHANDATRLRRGPGGRARMADAQWNDDWHHAAHVLVTGERDGYYADFAGRPATRLARTLAEGFGYQGEPSVFAGGKPRGTPSSHLPPTSFVNSLQTHDQVGNRAFGERIARLAREAGREDTLRAMAACLALAPAVPMLFMGEEFAASAPFLYFCDFDAELGAAVREGRRAEFAPFARFADVAARARIPDPNAPETFERSRLDWSEATREPHAHWLAFYTELLRRRRDELHPWLEGAQAGTWSMHADTLAHVHWPLGGGRRWHLLLHAGEQALPATALADVASLPGRIVYLSAPVDQTLPPWWVRFSVEEP